MSAVRAVLLAAIAAVLLGRPSLAGNVLEEIGFDPRPGTMVPDAGFVDAEGEAVSLRAAQGGRPALLVPAYYECPNLCGLTLRGVAEAAAALPYGAGEFRILVMSIDAREGPRQAGRARARLADAFGQAALAPWRFLTGTRQAIAQVSDAIGFRAIYDPEHAQFAHAAGAVLLTPEGRVARYLAGIRFEPRDLRLGLVEAGAGRIGGLSERLLLLCYDYDEVSGRYTGLVRNLLRGGALLSMLLLGAAIGAWLWQERRRDTPRGRDS